MLIVRAPLRISFAGGGTDLPAYYETEGGLVTSAAIARYVYVFVQAQPGQRLEITSSDYQTFFSQDPDEKLSQDGDLGLAKAVLDHYGVTSGLSLFIASEVPPGTGLGSSSSLAVALIKAISTLQGRQMTPKQIADKACEIEIDILGAPIGKQDQYAAAFGGINRIEFSADEICVNPIKMASESQITLARNLMLFYTGSSRSASAILEKQTARARAGEEDLRKKMTDLKIYAERASECLLHDDLDGLGRLLHQGWEIKRSLSDGISNGFIDGCYEAALEAGAIGGKITGAGGGGFLLLYARPDAQREITARLKARGLFRMTCDIDTTGARILLNAGRSIPGLLR